MAGKTRPDGPELELYADGSFSIELGLGTWAFRVPKVNLQAVGISEGRTAARFEFLGVLHGLEAIAATDPSGTPIHVFTDCESTVDAIDRFRAGLELKKASMYEDRLDLIPRLRVLITDRQVRVTRVGGGQIEHQNCHRDALRRLREEIAKNPKTRYRLALVRQEARLAQLAGERGTILRRLEKAEEEISLVTAEIEALEAALAILDETPKAARKTVPPVETEDGAAQSDAPVQ